LLYNCIVWGNEPYSGDLHILGLTHHSCSQYKTLDTYGNININPQFVSASDFRLLATSPCIDTALNADALSDTDLAGNPRIVDGNFDLVNIVDMGAYEYDPVSTDSDGDRFSDFDEHTADTGLLDSNDWFRITGNTSGTVFFDSSDARRYALMGCTNLVEGIWTPAAPARMGVGGADSMSGTNAVPAEFYKLEVEMP